MSGASKVGRGARRKEPVGGIERHIILIDQKPLRRATGAECSAAMAKLDDARAAWHRFEREDRPSFVRWRAREFGPLLSELRDVEAGIRESEALVHEVEMEMRRGFYDPWSAYQRVMFRRENPSLADNGAEPVHRPRARAGEEQKFFTEFEKEALFQEWVQKFIGTNPDKLDDEAYTTTFEAFKTHMFRTRPEEPPPSTNSRAAKPEPRPAAEEEPAPAPIDARVKELYRLLVRRLHPDLRADGSAAVSALWHEVQEAYGASDIAHLEILLALSDIESDRFSDQTSVSQMRAVLAELTRALFALEDSLRQARDEDAWGFARTGPVSGLRERVERELKATLRMRSDRLDLLKRTIADWSRSPLTSGPIQFGQSLGTFSQKPRRAI
ncbi:MAG TPA: J domain-containing protein [Chthoniobacterales bacterium]|nr:J domain-containing protein [Chthoniobacterales bacterium]